MEKTIKVFLSYAAGDEQPARELRKKLFSALGTQKLFNFEPWPFDEQLLVGEDFHEEIQKAISVAEIGIFAISVNFLNSKYIAAHELPHFMRIDSKKKIVPIMLNPIPAMADLRGLKERQIFGFDDPYTARSNGSPRPLPKRKVWANSLADELHRLVKRYDIGE